MNYITFGKGEKPLILIQGLSTRSIKGVAFSVAYMYRMFARDYKVYFQRWLPNDAVHWKHNSIDYNLYAYDNKSTRKRKS